MADLSIEDKRSLTTLLRQNHFDYYARLNMFCQLPKREFKGFKAILNPGMEWPNMIYDIRCDAEEPDSILSEIRSGIDSGDLPELLIIDTYAKSEQFDSVARKYGMLPVMRWPGMVFHLSGEVQVKMPDSFEIRQVSNQAMLIEWTAVVNETFFQKTGIHEKALTGILDTNDLELFVGYSKGTPASTLMINYRTKEAGIYMVSTRPEYTGRGFMTTIMHYALIRTAARGLKYALLEATPQSYKIYRQIGFQDIANFDIFWRANKTQQ